MTINTAKLISVTPDAEKHMAYCARVSNPANQENEKFSALYASTLEYTSDSSASTRDFIFLTISFNFSLSIKKWEVTLPF